MFIKSIDYEKCNACMLCQSICTNSKVIAPNAAGKPEFLHDIRCIYCGHCLAVCPQGAITFTPVPASEPQNAAYYADTIERSAEHPAIQTEDVFDFLCSTRSNRIFLRRPVERMKLETIIDAMVRSSSAGNEQNRNFYVLTNPETLDRIERKLKEHYDRKLKMALNPVSRALYSFVTALHAGKQAASSGTPKLSLAKRYRLAKSMLREVMPDSESSLSYLKMAPALILITRGKKNNRMHKSFYRGDACIAATYGIFMAKALGLASCWIGLLQIALSQNKQLGALLGLKPGEQLDAAVTVGYSDIAWHRLPPRGPVEVTWME